MQSNHFLQIILDEIAAEGLEGVTLECLWNYLSVHNYFKTIDVKYKSYLWKFIINFKEVNFFKLHEPRICNFKIQDRHNQYKYPQDAFLESVSYNSIPPNQIYTFQLISEPNVFGSCSNFHNRILIDDEIKSSTSNSYSDIVERFGNSLVIVANQEYRFKFLGIENSENNKQPISKMSYALLEYIGRSRYSGVKAVGKYSALEFLKDAQSVWFMKRKLKNKNLIRTQKINFLQPNNTIKDIVIFQINRFYKSWYNIFESNLERFLLCCSTINSAGILKSTFLETLGFSEEFLKLAKKLGWIDIIITTYRILNLNVDIDQIPSDEQLLKFYIEDFQLPDDESNTMSLINKRSCFIKPIKSLSDLKEQSEKRAALYEDYEESIKDVFVSINDGGLNVDEIMELQILGVLAQRPMTALEIKKTVNLSSGVRAISRHLMKSKKVLINVQTVEKHSKPFFSINQKLFKPLNIPDSVVEEPMVIVEEKPVNIPNNSKNVSPLIKNPKRKERYDFLVNMVKQEIILSDYFSVQNKIKEWEASLNRKEVMDRKSFKRILDDAINNGCVTKIEVVLETLKSPITENWLVLPGTSKDSSIFKEHYLRRLESYAYKNRNIKLVTKSNKKKKKKSRVNPLDYSSQINIFHEIKDTKWIDESIDFKLPEVPIMLRRKLLHEFIWYVCVGCHAEANINFKPERDDLGFNIYMNSFDWRRYVAPLHPDSADKFITFSLNDLLLRMPLFLLCLWSLPKTCNQELYDALVDENLRWATLENLILHKKSLIAFILNSSNKLGLSKVVSLIESLLNMGLITKRDQIAPIKYKIDALYYLNQHVFLTDTTNFRLPISDETIWAKFPRFQWILNSEVDLINYWENIYNVCTNTRCGEIGCKSNGIQVLSNYSQEFIRNSDYIIKHVVKNGPISIDHARCINQFGVWLPGVNNIKWKHLGPGGFSLSISSWAMVTWCLDRFDKICSEVLEPVNNLFRQFQRSLFTETITDMNSYTHISSLNENLSLILNEINVTLTGAEILRYLDNLEGFWSRIRLKKWFKHTFSHVYFLSYNSIQRYIRQLTPEYDKERKELITEARNFKAIEEHSKLSNLKEYRKQFPTKEANIIRILMLTLMKLHRFIPQWNVVGDRHVEILKEYPGQLKIEHVESNVVDVIKITPATSDNTTSVSDIVMLSLKKYLMGCMSPFKESYQINYEKRNKILYAYSKDMLLAVVNDFKNFYANEPLKNSNLEMIKSGMLDRRLNRLSKRLTFRNSIESMINNFNRRWRDWTRFPEMHKYESNSVKMHNFEYSLHKCNATDVMGLIGISYAVDGKAENFGDFLDIIMGSDNSLFDKKKCKTKSVCYSSVYNINMKMKNLAKVDWFKFTSGAKIFVNITDATYNKLFVNNPKIMLWKTLSEFQNVPENEHCRKRLRSSTKKSDTVLDILEYIDSGEFGGRNYNELNKKFTNSEYLVPQLQKLLVDKAIYLVGINTFHFVGHKYIKPWVIKIPLTNQFDSTIPDKENRKRKKSSSSSCQNDLEPQYFIPEFYRGEQGEFKCVTFAEIISRLFNFIYKNSANTLDRLINELSIYLGEVVVKKLVGVLVEFEILELRSVKRSGQCGLFRKRTLYEDTMYNPFDNQHSTTVFIHPLSFLKMSHLIEDMSKYFCVKLDEYIT